MKFKVGDRVIGYYSCGGSVGGIVRHIGKLKRDDEKIWGEDDSIWSEWEHKEWADNKEKWSYFRYSTNKIILIKEGSMDKYTELKQRIERLDGNSSLKEVDDILQTIKIESMNTYLFFIPMGNSGKIHIYDFNKSTNFQSISEKDCEFNSQCEKLDALKNALLWLLEHSDIKKDEKQEKIEAIKKEIEEMEKKHKDLQRQIEELERR